MTGLTGPTCPAHYNRNYPSNHRYGQYDTCSRGDHSCGDVHNDSLASDWIAIKTIDNLACMSSQPFNLIE